MTTASTSLLGATPLARAVRWLSRVPYAAVALLARFALAAVFWSSGQTKVRQ